MREPRPRCQPHTALTSCIPAFIVQVVENAAAEDDLHTEQGQHLQAREAAVAKKQRQLGEREQQLQAREGAVAKRQRQLGERVQQLQTSGKLLPKSSISSRREGQVFQRSS